MSKIIERKSGRAMPSISPADALAISYLAKLPAKERTKIYESELKDLISEEAKQIVRKLLPKHLEAKTPLASVPRQYA